MKNISNRNGKQGKRKKLKAKKSKIEIPAFSRPFVHPIAFDLTYRNPSNPYEAEGYCAGFKFEASLEPTPLVI